MPVEKRKPTGSLISYFSRKVTRSQGINLAQGKPGFSPPPELLQILKKKSNDKNLHQYAPGNGNFHLLKLLEATYSRFSPINQDNLLIVQGATEGISLIFFYLTTFLTKPYSVLSFDPVYESYPKLANIFNIPFFYFDYKDDLSIDFAKLDSFIKQKKVKIVFIASPGNPLGRVWKTNEVEQMLSLSKKYNLYLIFDSVYKDIYFTEIPYNPLLDKQSSILSDRLFYVTSFSKMLSITGWRVGYIITEKNHMKKIRDIHDYTGLSAPSLFQSVIYEYLRSYNHGQKYTEEIRNKCWESYAYMKNKLEQINFEIPDIEGGYFLWAKLPPQFKDAFLFASHLYDTVNVGVVPGENFSETKNEFVRLNIATEMSIIKEGAQKIIECVKGSH
jgi:aspartate/methionine/tyrosine aminotransferase